VNTASLIPFATRYAVTFPGRPTFFLDADVQGILTPASAYPIAAAVLGLDAERAIESGLDVAPIEWRDPA